MITLVVQYLRLGVVFDPLGIAPSRLKAAGGQPGVAGDSCQALGPGITVGAGAAAAGSVNLVQGHPAQQSDHGSTAGLVVDGNTSGVGSDMSLASAGGYQPMPWWEVDLGERRAIGAIQVRPRTRRMLPRPARRFRRLRC